MDTPVRFGDFGDKCDEDTELGTGDRFIGQCGVLKLPLGVIVALKTLVAFEDPVEDQKKKDECDDS